jgi:hypothetical protein
MTVTEVDYSMDFTEEDFEDYLQVCFAVSGGFSKGTANVSAGDVKKLHPLLKHYAKMKHPFTACVRDNRKRFGPKTEAYCAVLKDLIVGSTNWRGKGKKYTPHNLSEMTEEELTTEFGEFALEFPEGFAYYLTELTEEDIQLMIDSIPDTSDFAEGDVVWDYSNSFDKIRSEINEHFREEHNEDGEMDYAHSYWVEDLNSKEALVCYNGMDYFVVPYSFKKGSVVVSEEEDWKPVEKAWVETNLSEQTQEASELFFDDKIATEPIEEDGLIWKSILREGEWKYSPGPKGPIKKDLKIVKNGFSDKHKNIISLEEVKANFEQNIFDNVTVPLSHKDLTEENTGHVRKMRFGKDEKGRHILEAGLEITEPDIKGKIMRKTIPNVSAGILWDYIKKDTGKKYNTVMNHLALVSHPYISELAPFSEVDNKVLDVSCFSEHEMIENMELTTLSNEDVNTNIKIPRGGEEVSTDTEKTEVVTVIDRTFFDELGLGEDDIREIVASHSALKAEQRKNSIDTKGKDWQDAGKSPALVKAAKEILFADDDTVSINFSEDGVTKTLSLSEVVDRLVEASPSIDLTDKLNEEDVAGEAPDADASKENERANFSDDVLALATQIWMDENLSEEEALKEAVKRSKS